MSKATVTVRELKNKDTGVDLAVTGYREVSGLIRSNFEFQILIVSNLSCFKLPSHKESDVVQFTIYKKFSDIEDLRVRLNQVFSGTAFPPLSKKSLIVNEAVIRERRNNLDSFMKFLAATPRIVSSSVVLTFLGVDAIKAKRFSTGEKDDLPVQDKDRVGEDKSKEQEENSSADVESAAVNLFDDDDVYNEDEEIDKNILGSAARDNPHLEDDDFFADSIRSGARLFEDQDMKRELTEDDEKDFSFIPDAILKKQEVVALASEEDNEDLLTVDEEIDLDNLLKLGRENESQASHKQLVQSKPLALEHNTTSVTQTPRPELKPKPSIPTKPKQVGDAKPTKPAVRKLKPQTAPQLEKAKPVEVKKMATDKPVNEDLSTDDIVSYIAKNTANSDSDLDLFS